MKKHLLYLAAACSLLAVSCNKTESSKPAASVSANQFDKLKLNAAGDYGTFQINQIAANKSLKINALSLSDGGVVGLKAFNTDSAQCKWRITDQGNGYYKIMNGISGKYLQSYLYAGAQRLIQVSNYNIDDQLWSITQTPNGFYSIINKASNLAISNPTGSNADDTQLTLLPYINVSVQWFGFLQFANDSYRDDDVVKFFHRTQTSQGSVAFDQGDSIPLADGRVIWVAEDSFDGGSLTADGNIKCNYIFSYRNSMLIQPASRTWDNTQTPNITINNSAQGRPKQVCDTQPGMDWTWPGNGIEIGNKVYVSAGEGKGLSGVSTAFYILTENPSSNVWAVKRDTANGMNNKLGIGYGGGYVKASDGYIYTMGSSGSGFNASNLYAARFLPASPLSWTFWNGNTWVANPVKTRAAIIGTSQQNVTMGFAKGKYILMQMDLGFLCDPNPHNIYLSTSSSPTGPFTTPVKVFTIQDRDAQHIIRYYTPGLHTEFDNGKNELLLTYSVNYSACSSADDACVNGETESRKYQVKGVRVPYSKIGL